MTLRFDCGDRKRADPCEKRKNLKGDTAVRNRSIRNILSFFFTLSILVNLFSLNASAAEYEEPILLTGRFDSAAYSEELSYQFPYRDSYFSGSAAEYRHGLAQCTLGMAVSAFRSADQELDRKDQNIREYFTQAGFSQMESREFNERPTAKTIATLIASKTLKDRKGEYVLLAVAVSGGGYQDEWLSNFSFGDESVHEGFFSAGFTVFERVFDYVDQYAAGKRVKIWMGGYSRAAAVSNMAAVLMLTAEQIAPEDLFVYTFATPNNAQAEKFGDEYDYSSVYNIVGMFDPIPSIPFSEWGYGKLGTTLRLPARETTPDYEARCEPVKKVYREITGGIYESSPECNWFIQKLYQLLYDMIGTAEHYQAEVEGVIDPAWEKNSSTYTLLREICRILSQDAEIDHMLLGEAPTADTLLSVFLYDLSMEKLGFEKNTLGRLPLTSQLFYEHCPEVYVSWVMSQDQPEKLFVSDTSYRRIFLPLDTEYLLTDGMEQPVASPCAAVLGNTRMLTIPAGEDYVLSLLPIGKESRFIKVMAYEAGSMRYVYQLYQVEGKENGWFQLGLPKAQPYELDGISLKAPGGDLVFPAERALDREEIPPSAVFELEGSGWLPSHFIRVTAAILLILILLLAAFFIWLPIHFIRKRKKRRGSGTE